MITDWWSFDVLHTQFADAYRAVTAGGAPLRRSAVQYADFASWQRELKAAGVLDARLGFWESYLADPPHPCRPGAAPRLRSSGSPKSPSPWTRDGASGTGVGPQPRHDRVHGSDGGGRRVHAPASPAPPTWCWAPLSPTGGQRGATGHRLCHESRAHSLAGGPGRSLAT
ncbi:hypothetical protein E4K10_48265 [Streptomyces sp. T1317-0309]|nr:hypothetical protein E4K10_48265 [Streptomyces sp. T1317-0309]